MNYAGTDGFFFAGSGGVSTYYTWIRVDQDKDPNDYKIVKNFIDDM